MSAQPPSDRPLRAGEPTAQSLAASLAARWPTLAPAERVAILSTFARAGIAAASGNDGSAPAAAASPRLLALCELPRAARVSSAAAALAATEMLLEFATTIEDVTWETWREVAPQSARRSGGGVGSFVGQVLIADADAPRAEAAAMLGRITKLFAAIMYAVPHSAFAAVEHFRNLMPNAIRDAVDAGDGAGTGAKRDSACWKKYNELVRDFDEGVLENKVRRSVAQHVDRFAPRE